MANKGKNSNSSQWFVVLTSDQAKLDKLKGKYVVFGEAIEGLHVLDALDAIGSEDGTPTQPTWISVCGIQEST